MKHTLTIDQCKMLLRTIRESGSKNSKAIDFGLVVCVLMCGASARIWTWEDALRHPIHQPFAVYEAVKNIAITRKLSIFPYNHAGFKHAHWVNGPRLENAVFGLDAPRRGYSTTGIKPFTTQEVTRRLKRYAVKAGIPAEIVNLRALANTHQMFLDVFGDADSFAEALDLLRFGSEPALLSPFNASPITEARDLRLHGIGRRSSMRPA